MRRFNLSGAEIQFDDDDPEGYHAGYFRVGTALGAAMLGATLYELPPGQSNCPYHYEYGNEEWVLVLDGRLTVRHPEGEVELERGGSPASPSAPTAPTSSPTAARRPAASCGLHHGEPSVAVYPDSDKSASGRATSATTSWCPATPSWTTGRARPRWPRRRPRAPRRPR